MNWRNMVYLLRSPWDSGQPPQELARLVPSGELAPGLAIGLGCGTDTSLVRLAPLVGLALSLLVIVFISLLRPTVTGAPWVPSSRRTVRRMLRLARVQPGETVYDLGSGDGRVLIIAAREFGARAVGIEIDSLRYLWTRLLIVVLGLGDRVSVQHADFFSVDLGEADVVTLYLLQRTNNRLMPKLWRELRPGAWVVSHAFTFPGWRPVAEEGNIRLYRREGGR